MGFLAVFLSLCVFIGCHVIAGSTPVVAFGDVRRARVATLGLNPSRAEFETENRASGERFLKLIENRFLPSGGDSPASSPRRIEALDLPYYADAWVRQNNRDNSS